MQSSSPKEDHKNGHDHRALLRHKFLMSRKSSSCTSKAKAPHKSEKKKTPKNKVVIALFIHSIYNNQCLVCNINTKLRKRKY